MPILRQFFVTLFQIYTYKRRSIIFQMWNNIFILPVETLIYSFWQILPTQLIHITPYSP